MAWHGPHERNAWSLIEKAEGKQQAHGKKRVSSNVMGWEGMGWDGKRSQPTQPNKPFLSFF